MQCRTIIVVVVIVASFTMLTCSPHLFAQAQDDLFNGDILNEIRLYMAPQDLDTIDRFHRTFIDAGLSLKFQTFGRAPQSYYPTYRELLFETDREGQRANFLVNEDDYQFVRGLQQRDLIIPVVGNIAGPSALAAIGRAVRQHGEAVTVFYVSNVELYLFRDGQFQHYADTLSALPRNSRSVLATRRVAIRFGA